jgi:CHAD domain-containing protein
VFAKRAAGASEQWPARLREERSRAHKKLVAVYDRLGRDKRLRRRIDKLLDRLRARNSSATERFADRAGKALCPLVAGFFEASPADAGNQDALHRFRLAGKDLRYAMELLAPAFGPPVRDELYPVLATLQEKLGLLNDLVAAQERLRKRIERTGNAAELSDLRRRFAAAGEEMVRAREDFERWWTPAAHEALRDRFEALCGSAQ